MRRSSLVALIAGLPALAAIAACDNTLDPIGQVTMVRSCPTVLPLYVGYRTEGGEWQRVEPNPDSAYVIAAAGRLVTARVDTSFNNVFVRFAYTTAAELGPVLVPGCDTRPMTKQVTGTVTGIPSNGVAHLYAGGGHALVTSDGQFGMTVNDGTVDLVGVTHVQTCSGNGLRVGRVFLRRDVDEDQAFAPFSFETDGVAPEEHTLTVTGLGAGETVLAAFEFLTTTNTVGTTRYCDIAPPTIPFQSVPASLLRDGDLHAVFLHSRGGAKRVVGAYHKEGRDFTLAFGPVAATGTRTLVASDPVARHRVEIARQAEYGAGPVVSMSQDASSSGPRLFVSVSVSPGYAGAGSTWALEMPEPPVTGWLSTWNLRGAEPLATCSVFVSGGNSASSTSSNPLPGDVARSATSSCI